MYKKLLLIIIGAALINSAYALDATQQAEIVTAHNKLRQDVGTPAIKWSASLATTAQEWADSLKQNSGCKPSHKPKSDLGENLYWAGALIYSNGTSKVQAITPTLVTDFWGNEKQDYTLSSNSCATGKICGNYTQVVWKSTTEVGCGSAVCPDNTQVWVCNYSPAGNIAGHSPY